jgi:hypothetical protein
MRFQAVVYDREKVRSKWSSRLMTRLMMKLK